MRSATLALASRTASGASEEEGSKREWSSRSMLAKWSWGLRKASFGEWGGERKGRGRGGGRKVQPNAGPGGNGQGQGQGQKQGQGQAHHSGTSTQTERKEGQDSVSQATPGTPPLPTLYPVDVAVVAPVEDV